MNIPLVISTLKELSCWLDNSKSDQDRLHEIIRELEESELNECRLQQIKCELLAKVLFNPKWLGEVYVPGFIGDGTSYAWQKYLTQVAEICQNNL